MNLIGLAFTLVASVFVIALPKPLVPIPFLIGALYMTREPVLEVGFANFTLLQMLVLVGLIRSVAKGEHIAGGMNRVDIYLTIWAVLMLVTCIFHTTDAWVFRTGMIWTQLGSYFMFRIFVQNLKDVQLMFKVLCIVLIPLAVLMLVEKSIGKNLFAALGDGREIVDFRHGHFRARGPFGHAILAGVVGATCFPMALYLWKIDCKLAIIGMFSAGSIIVASTASGPIMLLLFILFGMSLYKAHEYLSVIGWLTLTVIVLLEVIMKDPSYFLMARIDISGGSTGWYRARLIQSSIEHLDEWWLVGTDYTRHWMPTGQIANPQHSDITNHLLWIGVMGGMSSLIFYIMALVAAFSAVGRALRENICVSFEHRFLIWTLGAILFGHAWNFISVSLYDQSVVFIYLILASIGAVQFPKSFADIEVTKVVGGIRQSRYVLMKRNNE